MQSQTPQHPQTSLLLLNQLPLNLHPTQSVLLMWVKAHTHCLLLSVSLFFFLTSCDFYCVCVAEGGTISPRRSTHITGNGGQRGFDADCRVSFKLHVISPNVFRLCFNFPPHMCLVELWCRCLCSASLGGLARATVTGLPAETVGPTESTTAAEQLQSHSSPHQDFAKEVSFCFITVTY